MNKTYAQTRSLYRVVTFFQIAVVAFAFAAAVKGAGEIDPTFMGGVFTQSNYKVNAMARQPDGKIVLGGNFEVMNGYPSLSVARLNADSTVDTSFYSPTYVGLINAIAILPDGKILIGGKLYSYRNGHYMYLTRLNADGTFDETFNEIPTTLTGQVDAVHDIEVGIDGKIWIAGSFAASGLKNKFARLNADGTVDATFDPPDQFLTIKDLAIQSDGKVVGALTDAGSGNSFIKRYNLDGSEDTAFVTLVTGSVAAIPAAINAIRVQPDDRILIAGDFGFVNNIERLDAARLNADGTLDTSFSITTNTVSSFINDIALGLDGKIIIGGRFTSVNGVQRRNAFRVDATGHTDDTFFPALGLADYVSSIVPLPDGSALFVIGETQAGDRVDRLLNNGAPDAAWHGLVGARGTVRDVVVLEDRKVLVAGDFNSANSFNRPTKIARFNADGTFDAAFDPVLPTGPDSAINALALQQDGKILIAGRELNGSFVFPIRRVNYNGSVDSTFILQSSSPAASAEIKDIAVQPDSKIVFVYTNGNSLHYARRLNSDGSFDGSFNMATFDGGASRLVVQPDGKIVAAGSFSLVNGIPRGGVTRLNADGTLDATFNPIGGASAPVFDVDVQTDGKIIIVGSFQSVNGTPRGCIARLNVNGTLDTGFNATAGQSVVRTVKIQIDGKMIIGGDFSTINNVPLNKIARLKPDGALDPIFHVGTGVQGTSVNTVALAPDSRIVIGGNFVKYNETPHSSIARLLNNSGEPTLFDFDGDGRADNAVFRPSSGVWYELRSEASSFYVLQFGRQGDRIAPADYDGDGRTDVAVFRDTVPGAGTLGYFYITNSVDDSITTQQFGSTGDVPVSGDWDGDGKADLAVYRDGVQGAFYYRPSGSPGEDFRQIVWGTNGDKPVTGDFDGDGKLDAAVFRPSTAYWYIVRSSDAQIIQLQFGISTDIPVVADFDGDGMTNVAVYRPSTGIWYTSTDPATNFGAVQFGAVGDVPVPADYDGDGRADVAVFRPSTGAWYMLRSTSGFTGVQFGISEDKPVPNAFIF